MAKVRIDRLMVERGLAPTRARAQAILSDTGAAVFAGTRRVHKPGTMVDEACALRVEGQGACERYVSRGGLKLEGALEHFEKSVEGLTALDLGASTGGFTDCLLQRGASHVIALDVVHGQLSPILRADERVTVRENVNARSLTDEDVPMLVDLIVADLSFISLKLVLPSAVRFLKPGGEIVALVKPQFEAGAGALGKGGIVRDEAVRHRAIWGVIDFAASELGLKILGVCDSAVAGGDGNLEAFLWARREAHL